MKLEIKCDKCGTILPKREAFEFRGKTVCDDCHIDLMIGVPEVDISNLPPEIQCSFIKIKQGWNRDRPNRHHYLKFNSER